MGPARVSSSVVRQLSGARLLDCQHSTMETILTYTTGHPHAAHGIASFRNEPWQHDWNRWTKPQGFDDDGVDIRKIRQGI